MSQDRTTNLWVNSDRAVLLQTAQAQVLNPDSPAHSRMVRIVFDSGSQWSYITQQVARELSLAPKGKQQLTVMTFGSDKAQSHECELVELNVVLKNRQTRQLSLFAVLLICEPLSSQPVNLCQNIFDHIMNLDLDDPVDSRSQSEVDILIGSDQYWDLATGKSRWGPDGPVALETGLGWMLSRHIPTSGTTQCSFLTTTHVFKIGAVPSSVEQGRLDELPQSFWDLESIGITGTEKTLYDDFCDTVTT